MLTKDDKKYISGTVSKAISGALVKNNKILIKEMVGLFTASNSYIKEVNEKLSDKIDKVEVKLIDKIDKVDEKLSDKIDKVLDQLKTDDNSINDHNKRIGKLEEKVFPINV
ncbi:MAG: hypothetical protein UR68_C0017G0038 [Candidatus Roizmanbacteria bacterium GW2011_GWA2_35_19]|uniref:Uncharacterized protein n=2 Tax=Candidatus Roizmaniibacteriota TaxID=1752723 RepID=A0A0G0EYV5_9BACT|nr:MAG: hypothetical protein UR63_C0055G0001 [Candidatus Roizmanbacteria bacterium GW2011_GWC2_35_12]KKP72362.1 MAG: hypothetical protein UR68_C0017G0038 [Candidatus Roizmanbacteria bacterium GW2011_GWA2_35_19]